MHPSRQRHFWTHEVKTMQQLADVMAHRIWSPLVWTDGLRHSNNFLESGLIALDFDDGRLTVAEALKLCEMSRVAFVLGTSKSHQKEKVTKTGKISPAVDRFRLVYKVASITRRRDFYEHTLDAIISLYPCDSSCRDAGRFFFPCKEIIAVSEGPLSLEWSEPTETSEQKKREIHARYAEHKRDGTLPAWVVSALRFGAPEGGRHKLCYRLGATLTALGYDEQHIIMLVKDSPLAAIGNEDIERAVLNGADAGLRELEELARETTPERQRSGPPA